MNVTSCMKRNVVSVHATTTIREAATILVKKHIGLLPIVDDDNKPIGVIGMRDMLTLELPDFVSFLTDVDFVHDFGAVEQSRHMLTSPGSRREMVEKNYAIARQHFSLKALEQKLRLVLTCFSDQ